MVKSIRLVILFSWVLVSISTTNMISVWIDIYLIWASVYSSLSHDMICDDDGDNNDDDDDSNI